MIRARWDEPRQKRLRALWAAKEPVRTIAAELRTSVGAIYIQAGKLGLPPRRRRKAGIAAPTGQQADRTRQRRFRGFTEQSGPRVVLPSYHPASREGATIFPSTVKPAALLPRILKSGEHSRKIGSLVMKGRWRGTPIVTLTIEERETCSRGCSEWASCYGNNMPYAQRVADDGTLTRRLWGELASLAAAHPGGFVVRLHVLGDFASLEYVAFWRQALIDFPALRVFGFTGWLPDTPIGKAIAELSAEQWDRFAVRSSGVAGERGAEVVDAAADAHGITCPAERDPDRCCATCGLCWATQRLISFVRH